MNALSPVQITDLRTKLLEEIVDPRGPFGLHLILQQETLIQWTRRNLPQDDPALQTLSQETVQKVEDVVIHRAFYHAVQQGAQKMIRSIKNEWRHLQSFSRFTHALNGLMEAFQIRNGKKTEQEPEIALLSEEKKEDDFIEIDFVERKTKKRATDSIQLLTQWKENPSSFLPKEQILPFLNENLKI